ncbi:CynX/NimT family MFS transporter [Gracilibacillus xinjiangensis]|uniref:CynX/NimT family MFS transporter n=1 Tax=Gracilibacillus xinjiangensis TaxID=1193282 RepID=A0ABV8WR80_9BACI
MPTNQKWKYSLFITGIIILAFNLRPAITSVGPIIGIIRDELLLDNWNVGLITSLPLLAFAFISPIAPRIANKTGNEKALLYGLIILLSGILIRSLATLLFLYIGTTLVGVGIAIINVILPSLIKGSFPTKIGLMTGLYTTSMSIFAAFGSGFSVPLTVDYGLGWNITLASWGIITVIGIIIWLVAMRNSPAEHEVKLFEPSGKRLLRSGIAWQVTFFMGLQSFLFYVTISWLAEILTAKGYDVTTAGWFVAYMQLISLPATFLTPIIAGKLKDQKVVVYVFGACAIIGYSGLHFNPSIALITLLITLIGFALGASISLALALLGLRTENARQAAELSGMAQSFGYLLASIGPIFIGFMFDLTGNWNSAITFILLVSLIMVAFGVGASRNKYVL